MHQNLNDPMLPYDTMALYEQPKPRFIFKMPRVVPDQKSKFENDELFRRLCRRDCEIRYTGYRERAMDERRIRFANGCREGHTEISFVATGTNLQLIFNGQHNPYTQQQDCDFEQEPGKVHIRSGFIMNGVCVRFCGWLHLDRLDGVGSLEFDERRALHEDALLREQVQQLEDSRRNYIEGRHMHNGGGAPGGPAVPRW